MKDIDLNVRKEDFEKENMKKENERFHKEVSWLLQILNKQVSGMKYKDYVERKKKNSGRTHSNGKNIKTADKNVNIFSETKNFIKY